MGQKQDVITTMQFSITMQFFQGFIYFTQDKPKMARGAEIKTRWQQREKEKRKECQGAGRQAEDPGSNKQPINSSVTHFVFKLRCMVEGREHDWRNMERKLWQQAEVIMCGLCQKALSEIVTSNFKLGIWFASSASPLALSVNPPRFSELSHRIYQTVVEEPTIPFPPWGKSAWDCMRCFGKPCCAFYLTF